MNTLADECRHAHTAIVKVEQIEPTDMGETTAVFPAQSLPSRLPHTWRGISAPAGIPQDKIHWVATTH